MTNKNGTSVLLWLVTASLIIYTASRSYDLISQTMPQNMKIAGFFALAALDGGLLAWLFWTTRSAAPGAQRTIGALMVVTCLAGIAAAVLGDTMMNFDPSTRSSIGTVAVWVVGFIIVANIAGTIAVELLSPDQQMRDAERAITSEIGRQKAKHLIENAPTIAADVAEQEAIHHAHQMTASFRQAFSDNGDGHAYAKDGAATPDATIVPARPKSNRRKTEAPTS